MAYQVLARKWRPRTFSAMVGQNHVLRALINALDSNRLHHAYLFTGTRGVGKTTIARILAKSLNCEQGVTAHPCGQCKACQEIDAGRFVDLIEVDAASRTGVEDTRDLLESVQYAPTRGRYKVYLIDEVHMLSISSFNALLKTLEEPPPHVKFLFATTDPQKLPPTVVSRCLQFNLKRLPVEQIAHHLATIAEHEQIDYVPPALRLLAKAAEGSVRDALSLLDQAIAYGGGHLTLDDVQRMLGTLDQKLAFDLVAALASGDAATVLTQVARLAEGNPDFSSVLADILSLLQRIAVAQVLPTSLDAAEPDNEMIAQLAHQLSPEDVQLFYQIGLLGRRDLPLAPDLRGGFEMVLLRMLAFRPETTISHSTSQIPTKQIISQAPRTAFPTETSSSQAPAPTPGTDDWHVLIQSLTVSGPVKQLAQNCALQKRQNDEWHLTLSPQYKFLLANGWKTKLESVLQEKYGTTQRLFIQIADPESKTPAEKTQQIREEQYTAVKNDPFITFLQETCEAQVIRIETK